MIIMRLKLIMIFLIAFLSVVNLSQAQTIINRKGPYLGQKPPEQNPELFLPGLITTLNVEYCISFLDQGRVCVFGREDIGVNYTYIKDGQWTEPQKMQLDPQLWEWKHSAGPDDRTLYFMSRRLTDKKDEKEEVNIYKMEWTGSGWTKQEMLPYPPNSTTYQEVYPSVTVDGTVYFHGGDFRNAPIIHQDIYRSRCVKGIYQEHESLHEPINTEYNEYDAFVAPDESYLIFGSDRPGGFGQYDSYICFQRKDGTWTHPANLGSPLNSISWENRVMVTHDGKYMFFVSGRRHELLEDELQNGRYTSATGFYWVDASFIQELKNQMIVSECASEIISREYNTCGIQAAVHKLIELKTEAKGNYHFSYFELLMLCQEMIKAGKISDSDIFYHALLDVVDEDYRIRLGYAIIFMMHQGQINKGLDLLKDALSDTPVELMVTVYTQSIKLLHKSRFEDALKLMLFNAREYPDHHLSNFGLARIYDQLGKTEQAVTSCEKTLQLFPGFVPAINLLKQLREKE